MATPFTIHHVILPALHHCTPGTFVIWYCNRQSSLVLHAQHDGSQIWLRLSLASLTDAVPGNRKPVDLFYEELSQNLWIKFDQRPDIFIQGAEDPWVDCKPDNLSELWLDFGSTEILIAFISWLSTATSSSIPRVTDGSHCPFCVLSLESSRPGGTHQLFHEGAYVDVFGNWLGDTSIEYLGAPFVRFYRVSPRLVLDHLGFRCGSLLMNGNSWGCRKIFAGVSAFAEHLRSSVGEICWKPLITCSTVCFLPSLELSEYAARSGLPAELFRLYPALKQITWGESANTTHLSQGIPSSNPSVWEQSEVLSTIMSESSSVTSTRMQSSSISRPSRGSQPGSKQTS